MQFSFPHDFTDSGLTGFIYGDKITLFSILSGLGNGFKRNEIGKILL